MVDLNLSRIPEELKKHFNWVNWTYQERDGKPTKIPIDPRTGRNAESDNRSTWATYEQAVKCWRECENERIQGIGFMLSNGFSGTDLDYCRNAYTGEILSWARDIIANLKSYSEITPSDEGIRVLTKGKLPDGRRVKGGFPSSDGGKKGKLEMYDSGRFFTVTGQHLEGTPFEIYPREKELTEVHFLYLGGKQKHSSVSPKNNTISLGDVELIEKAMEASNRAKFKKLWEGDWSDYPSQSEADLALCSILAFWTGNDVSRIDRLFRKSGLMREKWDERHGAQTYGARTIARAIEQTTEVYSPHISSETEKKSYDIGINLTDLGNARRFVAAHGRDLRYCYPWGKWLTWDGRRWRIDDTGEVNRRAKDVVRLIYLEASEEKDQDRRKALSSHALRCETDNKIKAMIELAKSEPKIPILPDEMDRDPWVLNVLNGTIDLLSGELQPHQREDYITKIAPVEFQPYAQCPYWLEHLNKIMGGTRTL